MKLVSLYTNRDDLFPPIAFHDGLNVVFARVKDFNVTSRDSHNLGKTFLIRVLDYALLADPGADHPFRRYDAFADFEFYLELVTDSGQWVTVCRRVVGKPQVRIYVSDVRQPRLNLLDPEDWTYPGLGLKAARARLDELLDLAAIQPYPYRKGLGYVLRDQGDYQDYFQLSDFKRGKDKYWKPYVAQLLGFDHALVLRKYELDDKVSDKKTLLEHYEKEAKARAGEYDKLRGIIELRRTEVDRMRQQLESFSFRELEAAVSERGVHGIEEQISGLNEERYRIDFELQELEKSLGAGAVFDLPRIQQVFAEAGVAFPEALSRSYEDLIDFNARLSTGRRERLTARQVALQEERGEILRRLDRLDQERQQVLAVLQEQETLQKYQFLQHELVLQEREIADLERRRDSLNQAVRVRREIAELETEAAGIVQRLRSAVESENETLDAIRQRFSDFVRRVLNVPALLSVRVNDSGNLMFDVVTLDSDLTERETHEKEGTSYRKILCACYDLAILSVFADRPFYHFVYHDGIFEGLDNRKKVNLMNLIGEVTATYGLQYILTVIDSDLPRDTRDQKQLFGPMEIIRELHDGGDEGRLFRMPAF